MKLSMILFVILTLTTSIHFILMDDVLATASDSASGIKAMQESIVSIPFSASFESAQLRLSTAKKVLFGYGQNCCVGSLRRLCENALKQKRFDDCFQFNQSSLDPQWVSQHSDIFAVHRGAGYWIWKPYLIWKLLTDDTLLQNGDYLVYMDAGAYPIDSLQDMFEFVEMNANYNGVLFFGVGLPQKEWCKRDAYILQKCDEPKCWDAGQINAFMSIWRKGQFAINLAEMWMNEVSDIRIVGDGHSELEEELEGFRAHRHDQAVITNIMNREGYPYGPSGWRLEKYIVHDRNTV